MVRQLLLVILLTTNALGDAPEAFIHFEANVERISKANNVKVNWRDDASGFFEEVCKSGNSRLHVTNGIEGKFSAEYLLRDGVFIGSTKSPGAEPTVWGVYKPHLRRPLVMQQYLHLWYLWGYLPKEFDLKSDLVEPWPLVQKMRSSGSFLSSNDVNQLIWQDNRLRVEIQLSSVHGYSLNRMKVRRLKELTEHDPQLPYELIVEVTAFKQFDGVWFPSNVATTTKINKGLDFFGKSRPAFEQSTLASISSIELEPDLSDRDFQLVNEIKNGTMINMQGTTELAFKWVDGKMVPATDAEAVLHARAAHFTPPIEHSGIPLWMFVVVGTLAALVSFGLLWWKFARKAT